MSFVTNIRFSASPHVADEAFVSPTLSQRLQNYLEPMMLYYIGLYIFLKTVLTTLIFHPRALFPFSQVRSKAFAQTWFTVGSSSASIGPLKSIVPLFNSASGVVLDLGPGDGRQLVNFTSPDIKILYGVEPCTELHPGLKAAAEKAGLGEKLRILDCGAQKGSLVPKLRQVGVVKDKAEGIFDTIVCSKVLCSVPNQEETVANLYTLLKPGGRLIICEHVKNPWRTPKGSLFARAIQQLFMLQGWSFLLGGCELTRRTGEVVKEVAAADGGWGKVDVEGVVSWGAIPFVLGEFVKKD